MPSLFEIRVEERGLAIERVRRRRQKSFKGTLGFSTINGCSSSLEEIKRRRTALFFKDMIGAFNVPLLPEKERLFLDFEAQK